MLIVSPDRVILVMSRVLLVAFILSTAAASLAQTAPWKPARNVEIIVGVGPGGGIDRTARTLHRIMQDQRLLPVPATVVNRPGGGGTIAQGGLLGGRFARVTSSDDWKSDIARSGGVNHYMNSRDLAAYLDAQYAVFSTVLGELDLAKLR